MTSSLLYLLATLLLCGAQIEENEAEEGTGFTVLYAECFVDSIVTGVTGYVDFRQVHPERLQVRVNLTGFDATDTILQHGFHVHTYGTLTNGCRDAGGHFNPAGSTHGGPTSSMRHVGDFGNIVENGMGQVMTRFEDHIATLIPGVYNILGRAIVIHARADDLGTSGTAASLSSGDAGARIGCCTIMASSGSRWAAEPAPTPGYIDS